MSPYEHSLPGGLAVKLISKITVRKILQVGSDTYNAAAAWVSTTAAAGLKRAKQKPEDVKGVINYLMKHKHGTPFEVGVLTMYVHAPIFVWREWHRHRIGFSYNEESARYKVLDPVFYVAPENRPVQKVEDWKPGRPKFLENSVVSRRVNARNAHSYAVAYENYLDNLDDNADPGFARDCLPVGIYSSCWVTCNPRSLMAFLSLRTHEPEAKHVSYPLYEIDVAARQVEELFKRYWPITHAAFVANGRVAP